MKHSILGQEGKMKAERALILMLTTGFALGILALVPKNEVIAHRSAWFSGKRHHEKGSTPTPICY